MSPNALRKHAMAVVGLVLVLLGWGAPNHGTAGPLAAVVPSDAAMLVGILGWGLVGLGLFLDGLPTPSDDREWVPDESTVDDRDDP